MRPKNRSARSWACLSIYLLLGLSLAACQVNPPVAPTATALPASTATPESTATPAPPAGVFWVDPSQDLGEISKFVLGVNHGPLFFLGPDNFEPVKQLGLTFLRWNGGTAADRADLQPFQIDLFMNELKIIGGEPSIMVRLPNSTPEKAAALVKYVNLDKQYNVKYWTIGNEPNDYPKDPAFQPLGFDAVTSAQRWHDFAVAMKAVDPTIKLYGPDLGQFKKDDPNFDPTDSQGRNYLREFLKLNGDLVDIVTVHRYPFQACLACQNNLPADPAGLLADTPEWENIIPDLRTVVKEVTGRDLPVGVTEYNSVTSNNLDTATSPDSIANAIWLADVMGRMIRHRPDLLAYWLLKSGPDDGHGLVDAHSQRPTYYVFQLYKQFGTHLLAANSPDDMVSVFAAKRDDGTVTVIFVNRAEAAVTKPFQLEKGEALKLSEVYLLDKDHKAEAVTLPTFKNGDAVELAGRSATLFVFKP